MSVFYTGNESVQRASEIRSQRLAAARAIATHTKEEWAALRSIFGDACVRCGADNRQIQKDHIVPLFMGGHDGFENLQPLCWRCNLNKGGDTTDWRDVAHYPWYMEFCRKMGWI